MAERKMARETTSLPVSPSVTRAVSAATSLAAGDAGDAEHLDVGGVDGQVAGQDDEDAEEDGPRDVAAGVADVGPEVDRVLVAAVGVEDVDEGDAEGEEPGPVERQRGRAFGDLLRQERGRGQEADHDRP